MFFLKFQHFGQKHEGEQGDLLQTFPFPRQVVFHTTPSNPQIKRIIYCLGTFLGKASLGTPLVWSTNDSQDIRYQPYNNYGPDYWIVEFKMNCTQLPSGWFELKVCQG